MSRPGIIAAYRSTLTLPAHAIELSLGEGNTPLIPVPRLVEELGGGFDLFIKYEGLNPTGSFKDRGMVVAVAEAAGRGMQTVICASTGNTAASAAAYAARAGMKAIIVIPAENVARGKLAGAAAYGARIIEVNGSFDDALTMVREAAKKHPVALVNSVNPFRIMGQKTAAFEIIDELGSAPDWLCIPVGNAGNITAYALGFKEYDVKKKSGRPHLLGVQAAGAAPLVRGAPVEHPETIASAIRIGNPARGAEALVAVKESDGMIVAAADKEILEAQTRLAHEGIWVEPASAAGLAGLKKQIAGGLEVEGKRVVIVCTGHGLKDPDIITLPEPTRIEATFSALERALAE